MPSRCRPACGERKGTLTTPAAVTASFKTYGPFRFNGIEPQPESTYNNLNPRYQLVFTNGVSQEQMDKNVKLKGGERATLTENFLDFSQRSRRAARGARPLLRRSRFSRPMRGRDRADQQHVPQPGHEL